jgi:hypothetical protein
VRFQNFLAARRGDEHLREEMETHLAMQTEENIRTGMSSAEAHRQARLKFGSVTSIRENYHAEEGLRFVENLLQDSRYAFRHLRKAPGFTAVAASTLALGLGASSAIFCLIDGLSLHPISSPSQSDCSIVAVWQTALQLLEGI